jgi:hypothetical protein
VREANSGASNLLDTFLLFTLSFSLFYRLLGELALLWMGPKVQRLVLQVSQFKVISFANFNTTKNTTTNSSKSQSKMAGLEQHLVESPKFHNDGTKSVSDSLRDREAKTIAALLTHYKALITLSGMPPENDATKEIAAAHSFRMQVENNALVGSCTAL